MWNFHILMAGTLPLNHQLVTGHRVASIRSCFCRFGTWLRGQIPLRLLEFLTLDLRFKHQKISHIIPKWWSSNWTNNTTHLKLKQETTHSAGAQNQLANATVSKKNLTSGASVSRRFRGMAFGWRSEWLNDFRRLLVPMFGVWTWTYVESVNALPKRSKTKRNSSKMNWT